MSAYEPPTFSFVGLQFNADIFENPLTETIQDPLPLNELNTNNIQAKVLGSAVSLYTNFNNFITLGGDLVQGINIITKAVFAIVNITCQSFVVAGIDGIRQIKFLLQTAGQISQEYYTDSVNTTVKSGEIIMTSTGSLTDNQGICTINAGQLQTPNTIVSVNPSILQTLYTTSTNVIAIGQAVGLGFQVVCPIICNTIVSSTVGSTVQLYTNFLVGATATIQIGNQYLVSLTSRAISLISYFDTNTLRSNTNPNQKIVQTFPSSTTQRETFFVDDSNGGVETCRISVAQGATPLVNNSGTMTLIGGTVSLTAETTNLCNTGASSVINCNAQLHPAYAYNATTGVLNTGAIGYTKFGTASTIGTLTAGLNVTRSTLTVEDDGIYLISTNQAVLSNSSAVTIQRVISTVEVFNGAGTFQIALGVGCIPTITTPALLIYVYHMPFTSVFIVQGATVALPFTFNLRLNALFSAGTLSSSNANFRFSITRLA